MPLLARPSQSTRQSELSICGQGRCLARRAAGSTPWERLEEQPSGQLHPTGTGAHDRVTMTASEPNGLGTHLGDLDLSTDCGDAVIG